MKRTIARRTNKKYPCNAESAEAIANEFKNPKTFSEFGLNLRKTEPFYIGTIELPSKYSFTVFASKQVMSLIDKHIPEDRKYMMDGTFDVTPLGCYYQLLVIHIEYQNDVSYAFNGKQIESYGATGATAATLRQFAITLVTITLLEKETAVIFEKKIVAIV